jgi:hypothetical protein
MANHKQEKEESEKWLAKKLARLFLVQLGVIDNKYFPFEEGLNDEKKQNRRSNLSTRGF